MKSSQDIAKRIKKYFNVEYIGSYILVQKKLLKEEDIYDIDIMCTKSTAENIRLFLEDEGFIETRKPIIHKGYADIEGSWVFKNDEYNLPIHICIAGSGVSVWSVKGIIGEKYERHNSHDLEQLGKILKILIPSS
jgi:hypothetical protein